MAISIPKYYKAMLDTLAYTEGTLGVSQNGYNILFNLYTIEGWTPTCVFGHQGSKWLVDSGGYKSTAAGRYQFLSTTWWELSTKNATDLKLQKLTTPLGGNYYYNAPFTNINQDYLGYKLISQKVSESSLIEASKSSSNFGKMLVNSKLDCTWTSLARGLPSGTDVKQRCGYKQAEPGKVVNKQICQPNGCSSGTDEIYTIYTMALAKY